MDDPPPRRRRELGRVPHEQAVPHRSEEHTSELQSLRHLVCRLLLEKKKTQRKRYVLNIPSPAAVAFVITNHPWYELHHGNALEPVPELNGIASHNAPAPALSRPALPSVFACTASSVVVTVIGQVLASP